MRQFADGEPTFQRMLPWAVKLERSWNEVAELPDEFWQGPGRRRTGTSTGLTGRIAWSRAAQRTFRTLAEEQGWVYAGAASSAPPPY